MRVSIIVDDNVVVVDGKGRTVDCSPLINDGIHAVQWHETFGEEEFRNELNEETKVLTRKPNNVITDFSPYQQYVDLWVIENDRQEVLEAEREKLFEAEREKMKAVNAKHQ